MPELTELTEEEINSLIYFYREKGDINRWAAWPHIAPRVQKYHPNLWIALVFEENAHLTVNTILDELAENI